MRCSIAIDGRPVPQGSMVASYNRKLGVSHVHHVAGSALAVWRASIREQAKAAGIVPSPLPISITIQFGMPRPKSHMIVRGGVWRVRMTDYYKHPAVAPDLDKLVRAVLDALSGLCYLDDSQVIAINAVKVYGGTTYITVTDEIEQVAPQLTFGMGAT